MLSHPATQGFPGIVYLLAMGSNEQSWLCMVILPHNKMCSRPDPLPKVSADLARHEYLPPLAEGPQLRIRGHLHLLRLAQQLGDFVIMLRHNLQARLSCMD